ncbi:MAG: aminotransferase class I/II-fold pyridoxal phosphate-dependent enzyme, partial [Planctomycetes bacterium]|nr:aminotransferase class I/II-fold pyridoxal phosphate-dependent enzyme [Planctomycetota bacterium]
MTIADRIAGLKPTAVNRVLQEVKALQANGRSLLSLMRGQPDTPTPAHIVDAAETALRDGHTGYPDNQGEPVLRHAVVEKLWRDNDLTYDPHREILITDGATGGIFTALAVLIQPGDDVLVPDPIYDAYSSPIAIWGGRAIPVRSSIREGRFSFDRNALEAAWTPRARVLLLNTPWNPTGSVLSREELTACVDFAIERHLHVVSDEIYEAFVCDGVRHISPAVLSAEAKRRTIVVNSLSKTYGMTGWRVGYCAAPPDIISAMLLVWQQFSRGPATFVQHAAAAALLGDQACVRQMSAEYQDRRNVVLRTLSGLAGVVPLIPQGGLFVMLDVRGLGMSSDEVRQFLLHDAGVV